MSVHAAFLPVALAHSGGGAGGDPPLAPGVSGALLDHHAALDAATALAEAAAEACVRWAGDAEEDGEAAGGLLAGPVAAHLVSASAACALLLSRSDLRQAAADSLPISTSAGPAAWLARCLRILARMGCRFSPRAAVAQRPLTPPLQPPAAAAVADAACLPPALHALLLAALATLLKDGDEGGGGGVAVDGTLQQRGPKRARLGDGRGEAEAEAEAEAEGERPGTSASLVGDGRGEAAEGERPGASASLVSAVLMYVGALVSSDGGAGGGDGAAAAVSSPPIIALPGGESIGPPVLAGGLGLRSLPLARAPHTDPLPAALSKASVALWPIAPPAKLAALAPAVAALARLMGACWAACDPARACAAADPPTALFCATLHRISAGLAARADQLQAILLPRGSPPSLLACLRSYAGGPGEPFVIFDRAASAAGGEAAAGEPVLLDDAEPNLIAACAASADGLGEYFLTRSLQ